MLKYLLSVERGTEHLNGRGKIDMKKWLIPKAVEENFLADNTVSSCYRIACNTKAANSVEKIIYPEDYLAHYHRGNYCGNADHQVLVTNDKNEIVGMKELNADKGVLDCTLYTDGNYNKEMAPSKINDYVNKTIYWKTTTKFVLFNIEYHHQGTVQLVDASKRNMS